MTTLRLLLRSSFLVYFASVFYLSHHHHTVTVYATTLVAVRFRNGVLLGADSRTSQGNHVSHRWADKLAYDSSCCTPGFAIGRAGSAATTQWLTRRLLEEVAVSSTTTPLDVTHAAHWLRRAVVEKDDDEATVGFLVVGTDRRTGRPRMYTIASTGALVEEVGSFMSSGSGSPYALSYLDDCVWDADGEDDEDVALERCRRAIEHAVQRDASSGGLVRIVSIRTDGTSKVETFPLRSSGKQELQSSELKGFAKAKHQPVTMVPRERI